MLIARAGARRVLEGLLHASIDARDPTAGARRIALLIMLAANIGIWM
jgi:hypothetical protein